MSPYSDSAREIMNMRHGVLTMPLQLLTLPKKPSILMECAAPMLTLYNRLCCSVVCMSTTSMGNPQPLPRKCRSEAGRCLNWFRNFCGLKTKAVLTRNIPNVDNKKCLTQQHGDIPKGCKLLRTEANKGKDGDLTLCVFGVFQNNATICGRQQTDLASI